MLHNTSITATSCWWSWTPFAARGLTTFHEQLFLTKMPKINTVEIPLVIHHLIAGQNCSCNNKVQFEFLEPWCNHNAYNRVIALRRMEAIPINYSFAFVVSACTTRIWTWKRAAFSQHFSIHITSEQRIEESLNAICVGVNNSIRLWSNANKRDPNGFLPMQSVDSYGHDRCNVPFRVKYSPLCFRSNGSSRSIQQNSSMTSLGYTYLTLMPLQKMVFGYSLTWFLAFLIGFGSGQWSPTTYGTRRLIHSHEVHELRFLRIPQKEWVVLYWAQ